MRQKVFQIQLCNRQINVLHSTKKLNKAVSTDLLLQQHYLVNRYAIFTVKVGNLTTLSLRAFTRSKSTVETAEQVVKSVQNSFNLVQKICPKTNQLM